MNGGGFLEVCGVLLRLLLLELRRRNLQRRGYLEQELGF